MSTSRREFLRVSALAGSTLGLGWSPLAAARQPRPPQASKILLLGGTGFIGPWQVHNLLKQGHELTLFNRGRSEPGLFQELYPKIETLVGDRNGNLAALEGRRTWDVVIDNSGYEPKQVRATAELFRDRTALYVFISSQAAYKSRVEIGIDETAAVGMAGQPEEEWAGYGPLKALSEREVTQVFGDARSLIVRPGLVVGPGDNTDRFTYWPVRLDRGGEVLAPNRPENAVQYIDVRDLAEFMVALAGQKKPGVFNIVGPEGDLDMNGFLYGIKAVTPTPSTLTYVHHEFLTSRGVKPFTDLPVWWPDAGATTGFARMSRARAIAAGLRYRPLAATAGDTLEWWKSEPAERRAKLRAGLAPDREAALLSEWRKRAG